VKQTLSVKTWKPRPLDLAIVEVLERKGPMTDTELFDLLKETHEGLGLRILNQTLMRLEVEGMVHVSSLSRGKRRVELIKRKETVP
jgi:Fe2+ or Zn2+ uptake regulation protein